MTYETTKKLTRAPESMDPRDVLAILVRRRAAMAGTFCILVAAVLAFALVRKPTYEARMSILVKRERVDPVVTTEEMPLQQVNQALAEQDLNSEVELLKSQDLIERAITDNGLLNQKPSLLGRVRDWLAGPGPSPAARRLASAVVEFRRHLTVEPVSKTTLIRVAYESVDPQLASRVLSRLTCARRGVPWPSTATFPASAR